MTDRKFKTISLAFGKLTKLGGWSKDLGTEEIQALQNLTEEQLRGGRIAHRIVKFKKGTPEEFEGIVYEIMLPEAVAGLKKTFNPKAKEEEI